jgi:hypothetical protein
MVKDGAPKVPVQKDLFLSCRRRHDSLLLLDIPCWLLSVEIHIKPKPNGDGRIPYLNAFGTPPLFLPSCLALLSPEISLEGLRHRLTVGAQGRAVGSRGCQHLVGGLEMALGRFQQDFGSACFRQLYGNFPDLS